MAIDEKTPPKMLLPSNLDPKRVVFGEDRIGEGEFRITGDPVKALLAYQRGEQAVCFLTETIPAEQLDL